MQFKKQNKNKKVCVLKRTSVIIWSIAFLASLSITATGYAKEFPVAGRVGLGLQINAFNFGIGPSLEYWASENVGLSVYLGGLRDYLLIGARGIYLFDAKLQTFSYPARPYLGVGYAYIQGPYYRHYNHFTGYGIELIGGIFQPLSSKVAIRGELVYQIYNDVPDYAEFNHFSLGAAIHYYF